MATSLQTQIEKCHILTDNQKYINQNDEISVRNSKCSPYQKISNTGTEDIVQGLRYMPHTQLTLIGPQHHRDPYGFLRPAHPWRSVHYRAPRSDPGNTWHHAVQAQHHQVIALNCKSHWPRIIKRHPSTSLDSPGGPKNKQTKSKLNFFLSQKLSEGEDVGGEELTFTVCRKVNLCRKRILMAQE